jgi:pSer/pThr/pTyr-binding forkhead associated (FHA) protein
MSVSLILVRNDGQQTEIALRPLQIIGRQTDCQIRIPSSGISRHHCEIAVNGGKVTVRDLGSSNGTYVNRNKVTQADLSAGDLITIGDLIFVVRIDGQPASVDSDDVLDEGQIVTPPPARKPAAAPAKKSPKSSLLDDDDMTDSSVTDFDFLDEDDDIKKQPKL